MNSIFAILLSMGTIFFSSQAMAHPMDAARLEILVAGDRIAVSLNIHYRSLAAITGESPPADLFAQLRLEFQDQTCAWLKPSVEPSEIAEFVKVKAVAVCPTPAGASNNLKLDLPFLKSMPLTFNLVGKVAGVREWEDSNFVLNHTTTLLRLGADSVHGFRDFLVLGMGHIGMSLDQWRGESGDWQLPEGMDHIAFVLAMVLAGTSLISLAKSVTGFTIGHSLTLGLATYKIIHIHSIWVEILIAFSIAYFAAMALLRRSNAHGLWVSTFFGCIHGLGFAGVLHDLQLTTDERVYSLLGFNLGVELAQLMIVIPCWILLEGLRRSDAKIFLVVHRLSALVLFLFGSYWFFDRWIT